MAATPTIKVGFGTGGDAVLIEEMRLEHNEFEHEMLRLVLPHARGDAKRFDSGVPISVTFGYPPHAVSTFVGYVSHVDPGYTLDNAMVPKATTVYALAPSYAFKNGGFASAKKVSASTVVQGLATNHRFQQQIERHPMLWATLAQAGRSEWEYMTALAKKCGYTLFAHGTALFFGSRRMVLSSIIAPPLAVHPRSLRGNLIDFKSSIGQTAPAGGNLRRWQVHGVDPRSGRAFALNTPATARRPTLGSVRPTPTFTAGVQEPADSIADAQGRLGASEGTNEMAVTAVATITGNPRARVGGAVRLSGIDSLNDGFWFIQGVTHEMRRPHSFTTTLRLGRDALMGSAIPLPATKVRTPSRSRLVNGQWVAA